MAISNPVRTWLYLVTEIPSVIVSIINLYYLLTTRTLRTALNNHVVILIVIFVLLFDMTTVIWSVHFYRIGTVLSLTYTFCLTSTFIDTILTVIITYLMAWASIERHILIFYSSWFGTKSKRFFFHYLPLATCIIYPIVFYIFMFFILPCNAEPNYYRLQCGFYDCISFNAVIGTVDAIVNNIIPILTVFLFNIILFLRVVYQKYHIRQRIEWRNYKKMVSQLLPIATVFILFLFPPMVLYTAYTAGLSWNVGADYFSDGVYLGYYGFILIPLALAVSLSELRTKCRNMILFWQRRHAVGPELLTMTRLKAGQNTVVLPRIR